MALFRGIYQDVCFGDLGGCFGGFRIGDWKRVGQGLQRPCSFNEPRLFIRDWATAILFWRSSKPPRNPGPSAAERHSPPVPFLPLFWWAPPVRSGPHTPLFKRQRAFFPEWRPVPSWFGRLIFTLLNFFSWMMRLIPSCMGNSIAVRALQPTYHYTSQPFPLQTPQYSSW